jgi:hypothetical protein
MATKTYAERRQAAYFAAARELYKLVVEIADENIDSPPEGRQKVSTATTLWAASLIATTYKKAAELERQGHEETVASVRQERQLYNLRRAALARTAEGREIGMTH